MVGFWEKACAALVALAAFVTTPATITADEDVAIEAVTEVAAAAVVVVCGAVVDENAKGAELDAMLIAVLDGKTDELGVDDGGVVLDEATLEEAMLLDVICMFDGMLEAILLLGVAVAVQNSCGTTL